MEAVTSELHPIDMSQSRAPSLVTQNSLHGKVLMAGDLTHATNLWRI